MPRMKAESTSNGAGAASRRLDSDGWKPIAQRLRRVNQSLKASLADRETELKRREEEIRSLSIGLAKARQDERDRLSGMLHDDLQQILVAAQMRLAAAQCDRDTDNHHLAEARGLVEEALATTRQLAADLSPPFDVGLHPESAIRWLADRAERLHGLQVDVEIGDRILPLVGAPQCRVLFEVVGELLLNVAKHAGAARTCVRASKDGHRWITITVEDDGAGCTALSDIRSTGSGLRRSRERIQAVGGTLDVQGRPGEGTTVTIELPPEPCRS